MPVAAQLPINTAATAETMAQSIFGTGISIISANYTGAPTASGTYSNGLTVAAGVVPADTGIILSTGNAVDVTNASGVTNIRGGTTTQHGTSGDADLNQIAGMTTFDAAIFEARFIPQGNTLTMQVTFSSEEYLEYVNSGFNDAVGVFVNGTKAELTVGDGDISIDNINTTSNPNLFLNNPAGTDNYNTEMDGLTVTLTLKADVVPDAENTIKIGIADAGDSSFDSNLLIAADSVQTALIARDDTVEIRGTENTATLDALSNDSSFSGTTIWISQINGQAVEPGDSVTLSSGESITLEQDGTLSITGSGTEATTTFSYGIIDADGNTDTGFVTATTIPCFVSGSLITTNEGDVPVEDLTIGDYVLTRDMGFQPVRWISQSARFAEDEDAPVLFEKGALGAHEQTEVSPNHRVLISSRYAQLLFGTNEVLVKAKHLVNGSSIRFRRNKKPVTYVHLLFDEHQIIIADGMLSESYHPGQQTMASFDSETRDEILRLMPNQDALMGYGYGPSARASLKAFEAKSLIASGHYSNGCEYGKILDDLTKQAA